MMHTLRKAGTRVLTVVGAVTVAVVVATGAIGVAQAAVATVPNNSVNSAKVVDNSLTRADIAANAITSSELADGGVNAADLSSPVRPRWAKVATNPTVLIRGRGVVTVAQTGSGEYDVTFDRDIESCGWFATRNDDGVGGGGPGEIAVEQASSSDHNRLRIRLFNSAGSQVHPESDDGFSVLVLC